MIYITFLERILGLIRYRFSLILSSFLSMYFIYMLTQRLLKFKHNPPNKT